MAERRTAKKPAKGRTVRAKRTAARPPMIFEKSAGAVVFARGKQVEYLLISQNYWEFPKGMIDPDEGETAAARREVREETGLEVELIPGFRESIQYFYRHKDGALVKKQVVYFLGEAKSRKVQLSWEHREARWVTFDEAMNLLQYENARTILKKANERIRA